ncbi:pentapeptide repeat-containing protein [Oscillatoria sp. FACHB-1407]|uniref:pentapeptide repeat-containing protein n=1 Tax=Oscillatoria sp. FACHB-1407 TaxID=2692847 RepID=UPI001685A52E|nr:pentapeptide repeat-containing protein [Oscillatoria sp. FACHB-1407]MBD2465019.1 pentapeptide repeat-containing protein [Oscillatoria sp. FACHB-1407]
MSFQFCWFRRTNGQGWAARWLIRQICLFAICLSIGGFFVLGVPANAEATDYNKQFLVGADFSGRSLTDDSFTKANLRYSNFSHSDLRGVSFFGANLEGANLEGATLSYATLDSARFVETNLTNAVLEGAFAFNANFDGATIDGADFTDVLLRQDVQERLCEIAQGTNPTTGRNTRETLECDFN